MELSQLTERAVGIQKKFARTESAAAGKVWGPAEVMQGMVGDMGDLAKLVLAKQGFRPIADLDAKLEHELADVLWSVLVLARMYHIDLDSAFERTMRQIERKLDTAMKG